MHLFMSLPFFVEEAIALWDIKSYEPEVFRYLVAVLGAVLCCARPQGGRWHARMSLAAATFVVVRSVAGMSPWGDLPVSSLVPWASIVLCATVAVLAFQVDAARNVVKFSLLAISVLAPVGGILVRSLFLWSKRCIFFARSIPWPVEAYYRSGLNCSFLLLLFASMYAVLMWLTFDRNVIAAIQGDTRP